MQKIDVLEAKLDNITKDLWRTTKLLEEFLASFNAAKDSLTDEVCNILNTFRSDFYFFIYFYIYFSGLDKIEIKFS